MSSVRENIVTRERFPAAKLYEVRSYSCFRLGRERDITVVTHLRRVWRETSTCFHALVSGREKRQLCQE